MGIYTGVRNSPSSARSATRPHVFAKRRLSDENWVYLPFMRFIDQELLAAPGIGQAKFESFYGQILQGSHNYRLYDFFYPYTVNGAFLLVTGQNGFTPTGPVEVLGLYQIQNENVEQYLPPYLPAGKQTWNGLEVSCNLDRLYPSFSVVEANGEIVTVDELFVFNNPGNDSLGFKAGNKSNTETDRGIAYFDNSKNNRTRWSNLDIIKYLFEFFVNDSGNAEIQWEIDGDGIGVLDKVFEVHDLRGKSIWECLSTLIPISYGLIFSTRLSYDSRSPVIQISSTYPPNTLENIGLTSGTRTRYFNINLEQHGVVENSLEFNETSTYDEIKVTGGPIFVTTTFSFYNGILEKNWSDELQQEFLLIEDQYPVTNREEADQARSAEKFSDVFLNFKVKENWNGIQEYNVFPGDVSGYSYVDYPAGGLNIFPKVDPTNGYLDFNFYKNPSLQGLQFEPRTPLQNEKNENSDTFVGVAIDPADIDVLTDEIGPKYFRIDNLAAIELTSANTELGEGELSFKINGYPNYQYCKNTLVFDSSGSYADIVDGSGAVDLSLIDVDKIKIDYYDVFITSTIKTRNKLNLVRNANTYYEVPRVKTIKLPEDLCIHVVMPNTISNIIPTDTSGFMFGDLEYYEDVTVIKNDMNKLRTIMELALSVYGIPRSVCTFTVADSLAHLRVGDYIISNIGRIGQTFINSPITSIKRAVTESGINTTITTSFEEISFESLFENVNFNYKEVQEYMFAVDGQRAVVRPKKGESTGKPIRRVDDFPEIPTSKSEIIFLTDRLTSQQNSQKYGAAKGDTRWHPLEKYTTLNGFPHELAGDTTS